MTVGFVPGQTGAPAARLPLVARANPGHGALALDVCASAAGSVRVRLFDVAGRVHAVRVVAGPLRSASLRFEGLRPGLYLARASQGGAEASTRVAVLE